MATSGTFDAGYSGNYRGRITWSASTNYSTLKTTVSYSLQIMNTVGQEGQATAKPFNAGVSFQNASTGAILVNHSMSNTVITIPTATWVTVYSNSYTVSHNSTTGVAPAITITAQWKSTDTTIYFFLQQQKISLNRINRNAYVSAAPNFTDEENPTMSYVVPSKSGTTMLQACISFDTLNDDIEYRDIDKNKTSYTFELTDAEREVLRNATLNGSNTKTVYFYVRSTVGGYTSTSKVAKTLTIINAEPELSYSLLDTNEKTVALTGDSLAVLIKGYSKVAYEMNATTKKGASIADYSAVNGSNTLKTSSGVFENVNDGNFKLSVTDNRGLTASKEFTLNVIDYFRPTASQEAEINMSGETKATVTLKVSGEWCSKNYGAAHNALRVEYRYKEKDGDYGEWSGTDYIADNNKYNVTFTIGDLDYTKAYTFQSRAVDSLDEAVTGEYTVRLIPVFDWSETDFNFNVPVNFNAGFSVSGGESGSADYPVEQGTEAMGTNGTWYWTKWASGKAECYGTGNYGNMAINKSWGSFYTSSELSQDLPATLFVDAPDLMSIDVYGCDEGWSWVLKDTRPTATNSGEFALMRLTSKTLNQLHLSFHAIGRWK